MKKHSFKARKLICSGHGCEECAKEAYSFKRRKSKEEFLKEMEEIHGERYDFSETVYVEWNTKVKVRCKKHDYVWETLPTNLLKGCGCPRCYSERKRAKNYGLNGEIFKEKVKEKYGDAFEVAFDEFVDCNTPIGLRCNVCGFEWRVAPKRILQGTGCSICNRKRDSERKTLSQEEFIERCRVAHGDFYDYSKVEYNGKRKKVKIVCPEHGLFEQEARCSYVWQRLPKVCC